MNPVELLAWQTRDANGWINKLIESIPFDKWEITPEVIESNVSWQVGHLIMSHYFHTVMTVVGHQSDVFEKIPLREYSNLYGYNSPPREAIGKVAPVTLKEQLTFMQRRSLEIIQGLSPDDLGSELEPTRVPHPIAKTKFETLDWNIKHTMWHCGQRSSDCSRST